MAPRLLNLVVALLAAVATFTLGSAANCGHGVAGILTGDNKYCCPSSCGSCGGAGCDKRPGGAANCCTSQIKTSCANVTKAPCLAVAVTPVPAPTPSGGSVCAAGSIPDAGKKVCCPSSCGKCGGDGCDKFPGGYSNCCSGTISNSNKVCSASVKAPCKISTAAPAPAPTPAGVCPVGSIPDAAKAACCPSTCKSCGGTDCDKRPGGASSCCSGPILKSSNVCSASVKAPCKVKAAAPTPAPAPKGKACQYDYDCLDTESCRVDASNPNQRPDPDNEGQYLYNAYCTVEKNCRGYETCGFSAYPGTGYTQSAVTQCCPDIYQCYAPTNDAYGFAKYQCFKNKTCPDGAQSCGGGNSPDGQNSYPDDTCCAPDEVCSYGPDSSAPRTSCGPAPPTPSPVATPAPTPGQA